MRFRGFLTNTDASILKLELEHGFKIKALSDNEAYDFIKDADKVPFREAGRTLSLQYPCLNFKEKKVYVIDNSIEVDVKTGESEGFHNIGSQFDYQVVLEYLNPTLQLTRLFKEGDLRMPLKYYYTIEHEKRDVKITIGNNEFFSREQYYLEKSEVTDLNSFLRDTKLPFKESFLQLALENYDLSYKISNRALSFLTLMISLETLLNPGRNELRYRISRNAAVLLGNDKEEYKKIYKDVKALYDKRSIITHTGKSNSFKKEDLLKLRYYVRESIKKMYLMKRNKDKILDLLNSSGFENNIT